MLAKAFNLFFLAIANFFEMIGSFTSAGATVARVAEAKALAFEDEAIINREADYKALLKATGLTAIPTPSERAPRSNSRVKAIAA